MCTNDHPTYISAFLELKGNKSRNRIAIPTHEDALHPESPFAAVLCAASLTKRVKSNKTITETAKQSQHLSSDILDDCMEDLSKCALYMKIRRSCGTKALKYSILLKNIMRNLWKFLDYVQIPHSQSRVSIL